MTDREKVIKGLECCIITPGFCSDDCPYIGKGDENDYCDEKLFKDALALLKAQEARLYTVDDLKRGEHYFLELHPEKTRGGIHYAKISSIDKWSDKLHGKFKAYDLIYGEKHTAYMYEWSYGKTWRCWTFRPTDEQREAVKWDE